MKTGDKKMVRYLPEGFLLHTAENKARLSSPESLYRAMLDGSFLEARVSFCDCQHNLHVDFGFMHGIIPREECAMGISDGSVRDIAIIARVNKPVRFVIDSINDGADKKIALLSRRRVQESFTENYLPTLIPGDIIDAKITHLENFGAFCDIGCGINGLLPIDSISVSRIPHPSVRFSVGDDIKVVIKSFDEMGRATLSHKELLGTWEENARAFTPGETVSGIIRSIEPYGIFVELTPNLSGLAEYTSSVSEGQHAGIYIKSIIPEKMKLKLIIVDSFDAQYPKENPRYFIKGSHIDHFRYSPENCSKIIETTFQ